MRKRSEANLPEDIRRTIRASVRLEWWTIFWLMTIVVAIYLVMGSSQAMKSAWVEDLLSLVPAISFIIAIQFVRRPPDSTYPYGYQRATTISFLIAATALLIVGAYIFYDSLMSLVKLEHPSIGVVKIGGITFWMGWLMIATLAYSAVAPIILGRKKIKLAKKLHEKTLYADADVQKADWQTALAGILGILGIGIGFWWADSVAAIFISASIIFDGVSRIRQSFSDLLDQRPTEVDSNKPSGDAERLVGLLKDLPWVEDAGIRLRIEGYMVGGEAFVVPRTDDNLVENLNNAAAMLQEDDWRLYDIVVVPVRVIGEDEGATGREASVIRN